MRRENCITSVVEIKMIINSSSLLLKFRLEVFGHPCASGLTSAVCYRGDSMSVICTRCSRNPRQSLFLLSRRVTSIAANLGAHFRKLWRSRHGRLGRLFVWRWHAVILSYFFFFSFSTWITRDSLLRKYDFILLRLWNMEN